MRKFKFIVMAVLGWLLFPGLLHAQDTNAPRTMLEAFEAQTGAVIIKGAANAGTINSGGAAVSVFSRESRNTGNGQKAYGLAIDLKSNNGAEQTLVVDYDELDSFLSAVTYISRVDFSATSLPTFDAVYTTRSGLQMTAHSSGKQPGSIHAVLRSGSAPLIKVPLTPELLAQFQVLLQQAKGTVDSLAGAK